MGLFWHQFWGWINPVVGAKLDHMKGEFEKYRGHFEIYRGQNSPRNFSPLTNGPFKKSQFSSNVGHFRSIGLFPLHADFSPYSQIMKIHHILYLSNTHLLGSRYCLSIQVQRSNQFKEPYGSIEYSSSGCENTCTHIATLDIIKI